MEEADNDDGIEYEMDVFLSPDLAPHMNLVQYPTHHHPVNIPLKARIKPRHGMIETDIATIDHTSVRTYSSQTIPINTHLCIGKVVPGGTSDRLVDSIHFIPLARIVQMRPTFSHLETAPTETGYTPEEANRPVTFQRKESERAAAARKSSYQYKKRSEEGEDWCELQVLGGSRSSTGAGGGVPRSTTTTKLEDVPDVVSSSDNNNREVYTQRTYCLDPENNLFQPAANNNNAYIQSLNYLGTTKDGMDAYDAAMNLEEAQANPQRALLLKLRTMLQSGAPIPFSTIRRRVHVESIMEYEDESILQSLQECAVLCRGNWCLLSKFCIELQDRLKRLRTLVLLLLEEDSIVHRDWLLSTFEEVGDPLSPEQVKTVLQLVAKLASGGWKPKIEDDNEFIVGHRDVCKRQRGFWQRQQDRFAQEISVYRKQGLK